MKPRRGNMTGRSWRLPAAVMAMTQEDTIRPHACCQCRQYRTHFVDAEKVLSGTSFDNHIKGSGADGRVENVTNHEVDTAARSLHTWSTIEGEMIFSKLEPMRKFLGLR